MSTRPEHDVKLLNWLSVSAMEETHCKGSQHIGATGPVQYQQVLVVWHAYYRPEHDVKLLNFFFYISPCSSATCT